MKKLWISAIAIVLFSGILLLAQVYTEKQYYKGVQTVLHTGDRICVIINPTSLAPTTTDQLVIDYTVTDSSMTCNSIVQGRLY